MKTTNQHAKYWRERQIDWNRAYTETYNHPHRQLIINQLKKWNWFSLFEIGCASGPNLLRIRQEFPKRDLGGMDINLSAIAEARRIDRQFMLILSKERGVLLNKEEANLISTIFPNVRPNFKKLSKEWFLERRDINDGIFLSDNGVDVILTDMTLIYIGPFKIKKILREIKRVARFNIIFVEFYAKSFWQRLILWLKTGYFAYNWPKLLTKIGFYDIGLSRLTEKDWPGGNPQKDYAAIITARI